MQIVGKGCKPLDRFAVAVERNRYVNLFGSDVDAGCMRIECWQGYINLDRLARLDIFVGY